MKIKSFIVGGFFSLAILTCLGNNLDLKQEGINMNSNVTNEKVATKNPSVIAEDKMDTLWGDNQLIHKDYSDKAEFFTNSKYAMFIHWGLYAKLGNKWQGRTYPGTSEWIMPRCRIKVGDYEKLAETFNPVNFNADEWVALAKAAGMKYIVITAKHHEGFAMFKSQHPFNIVDATPFKRDPLKELAVACNKAGLGFGVYYSQFLDWHEINQWDPKANMPFEEYFRTKSLPQIRELLTNYGPLTMIWFDTPGDMTKEQSMEIVNLMRELQPNALINSRIGNGVGDYSTMGDHELPTRRADGLWEAIDTSNGHWGYSQDMIYKSSSEILRRLINVVARGGNYMLNAGPDDQGIIPEILVELLKNTGEWLKTNGDTIYGAQPSLWEQSFNWGDCTRKDKKLFFHVFNWIPGDEIFAYGLTTSIKKVMWRTKSGSLEELTFEKENGWLKINLPLKKSETLVEVIEIELAEEPTNVATIIGVAPTGKTPLTTDFANYKNCKLEKNSWAELGAGWNHRQVLTKWQDTSQVTWEINIQKPGRYMIEMNYNHVRHSGWKLVTDEGNSIEFWLRKAGGAENIKRFVTFPCGIIEFKKTGNHTLTLAPVLNSPNESLKNQGGVDFASLSLKFHQ